VSERSIFEESPGELGEEDGEDHHGGCESRKRRDGELSKIDNDAWERKTNPVGRRFPGERRKRVDISFSLALRTKNERTGLTPCMIHIATSI